MIRMIIADDEKIVLDGISNSINWSEYDIEIVAKAQNGAELVEYSREHLPDIILTDICMPGMSGLNAIEELRKLLPNAEFLLVTAYEEFKYAQKAIELGVSCYLVKPLLKQDVVENVLLAKERLYKKKKALIGISHLRQIDGNGAVQEEEKSSAYNVVERAIEYMHLRLTDGVTLNDVANYVHMNPSYFSRHFKETVGISFTDYITNIKIDKAKYLLRNSDMKVYAISSLLGYTSVQYFSTLFRKITGQTPQEFKHQQ